MRLGVPRCMSSSVKYGFCRMLVMAEKGCGFVEDRLLSSPFFLPSCYYIHSLRQATLVLVSLVHFATQDTQVFTW